MTLKELSQLYYLTKEIDADMERLTVLRESLGDPSTSNLEGVPGTHGDESKVELLITEMVDLEEIIKNKRLKCMRERRKLEKWISDIPESYLRQIYTMRFVEKKAWMEIARQLNTTENSVKKACYRGLKRF